MSKMADLAGKQEQEEMDRMTKKLLFNGQTYNQRRYQEVQEEMYRMTKKLFFNGQTYNQRRYQEVKGWVIDALGGCCIECRSLDNLEIHHIKEVESRNRPWAWRIRDWENGLEQDNLLCLCKTCHDYLSMNPQHKIVSGMEKETELINKMEDSEGSSYLRIKKIKKP